MTQRANDQLDKVLALAESDHEGEALGALRMLRRILMREGLTFSDMAHAARQGSFSRSFFSSEQVQLEAKIDQMHDEIQAHVEQNVSLTNQIEFWRRRAFELEQLLALNQTETARWKDMARETAERLWDLGSIARAEVALEATVSDAVADDVEMKAAG